MKNASSVNAPLILFCYNRLETLKKVISSLQSDHLTQNTDIFIFSDGPKSDSISDKSKVEEVRKYLDSLENFSKSLKIFGHKENLGL
jgi:GT2 family glycosyltransferase